MFTCVNNTSDFTIASNQNRIEITSVGETKGAIM
jgi:hypothetical protein